MLADMCSSSMRLSGRGFYLTLLITKCVLSCSVTHYDTIQDTEDSLFLTRM